MGRVTPSPTFTLGFYLVIFGFWNLFLERLTPSRSIRFLNAPFYLLLFNIGAVTFFVSLYSSLTRELSYTRNLLSFILQHIPDHIYIKDRQSRFVNASLSSVKHLGLQRVEELIGKTDFDFFTPTRAQEFFEEEQRIIQSGTTTVSREEKEIQLDGRETWVSTTKIPWTNERGEIIGLIGISRDITSTVQQRFELEKRERFLSAIFEGVQDGLCVLDTEMNIVRANHFIEEMYPEERPLSGKKCFRAFHGQEHPCQSCPTILVFQTGQRQVKTMPYVRQGQQIGWLEVISYPLKDEKGNIYGVIEQVRNVTERMRYEEDLKTSEQNFRLFAEANPSAIIIYQDNRYVYVNSAAEKLTGYSREELTGMPVLRIIHPDFHALVQERVAKRQQNIPVDKQYEVKIITKDGRERWLFLSAETISYQGKWAGIVSASDVTEKKIQEMKTMHLKLVLEGIRNVGQTMIREEDPSVILEKVCYELVQNGAYTSVLLIPDFEENHRPFFAGMSEETAQKWISLLKEKELLLPEKIFTLTHSDLFPSSQGLFATLIAYGEQQMGTMAVTLPLEFINDPEEQNLFLELSRDLAFGLHTTELKKLKNEAQKNLEESERRFRNLIENLPLGVTTFQNGQFRYANPFASYVTDHFATSLRSFVEEKLSSRQAFSEAISFTIDDEVLLRGEDGEERWFFIRGRSIQY
ncbi:MAG: PAS domain S-box protein, partial [Atribacterota bacterium]|nr:PAS domain S-box protein [Atribacterota bacterium]